MDRVGCRKRESLEALGIELKPDVIDTRADRVPIDAYCSAAAGSRALSDCRFDAHTVGIEHVAAIAGHPEHVEIPGRDRLVDDQRVGKLSQGQSPKESVAWVAERRSQVLNELLIIY